MKTNYLVFGDGLLGNTFKYTSSNTIVLSKDQCDIRQKDDIRDALRYYSPKFVINAAGIVPRNEKASIEETFKVNTFSPHYMADLCYKKYRFVHISTDCVFAGTRGQYTEKDVPDAADLYGMSKALGEPTDALVLRLSFVGLPDPKGRGLFAWAQQQEEILGYDRVFWNGITVLEAVRQIKILVESGADSIRHVYGYTVSKYELLLLAKEIFGWTVNIYKETEDTSTPHISDKTLSSVYATGFVNKPLRQQLEEMALVT